MPTSGVTYLGVGEGRNNGSVPLVLYGSTTTYNSLAVTTEQTAYTYTLPKTSLATVNRLLRIRAFYTFPATTTSTRTVRAYFGTQVAVSAATVQGGTAMVGILEANICATSAAVQLAFTSATVGVAGGLTPTIGTTALTQNVSTSDIILKLTVQQSTAGTAADIAVRGFTIELLHEGSPD